MKDKKHKQATNLSTEIYISSRIEVDDYPSDRNTPNWKWLDLEDSPGLLAPKIILTHRGPVTGEKTWAIPGLNPGLGTIRHRTPV